MLGHVCGRQAPSAAPRPVGPAKYQRLCRARSYVLAADSTPRGWNLFEKICYAPHKQFGRRLLPPHAIFPDVAAVARRYIRRASVNGRLTSGRGPCTRRISPLPRPWGDSISERPGQGFQPRPCLLQIVLLQLNPRQQHSGHQEQSP